MMENTPMDDLGMRKFLQAVYFIKIVIVIIITPLIVAVVINQRGTQYS